MFAWMPTATSSTSASSVVAAPPAAGSTVTATPDPVFFADVSFVPTMILMPRLSNARCSSLLTSASSFGTSRGRYSTIVTSTPSAR